jgi:diguanylate cyclase (GGDEF)-like protein
VASDSQLSEVLSEFARTMVTDFPIQAILDHLVERIVDVMPVTGAGVTLISPGVEPRYLAASNDAARQFEKLQTELDEGPCLAAYHDGKAISVPDLRAEHRFPRFVARASRIGLGAVFTFPLRHGELRIGALDLYRDTPGELSAESMAAAQTLADVATAYLVNAEARADLKEVSRRSHELSLHDDLTGLPNRALLMERLEHCLRRSRRSGLASAVLFIDLDRFKAVNDTFGHRVGDELLVAVAERLGEALRPGDTLARVSGDEFVAVCEDLSAPAQADAVVVRLYAALERPFSMSGTELTIRASVGVSFAGPGLEGPEECLHAADMAMYRAKRAGGHRHEVVDLRDGHFSTRPASLEHDMLDLLARHELYLDYQPIVATADGHITGVEALLRWAHPSRGLVTPNLFIPLAEKVGLVPAVGQWVLEEACGQQARWRDGSHVDDLAVSVNVSAHQLMSPGFVDSVAAVVGTSPRPHSQLTLEITESVLLSDTKRALMVLHDLKALGVKLALDDFGTGFSALSYLLQLPVDIVKIDQVFVAGLGRDHASQAIVSAVVQLAHDLGLTVVAEGVETLAQHRELARLGCDSCQGFYFSHPMPAAEVELLIRHRSNGARPCLPAASGPGR